tara:strand:- start:385 stop:1602 length:1218 start_codon:yes stop_codon:yes gene_type:complete
MKLQLKNTPEQVELIKALGSKNPAVAREASEAFAAFLGPVIQQVLLQAGTAGLVFTDAPFNEDDSPSYPLDLYYNEGVGNITVWSQHLAGGLPTSFVSGVAELKISTYRLDSAVAWMKKYARKSRLDIVSKALERMAQEVLVKQERNAWAVVLKALAEATTGLPGATPTQKHVLASTTADVFQLHDLNKMMTLIKRLNESFAGGTPDAAYSRGMTDMFVSPEIMEQVRAFAYQPMNTRHGPVSDASQTSTAETWGSPTAGIPLPDSMREDIYRSAGMQEIYGVNLVELHEFGAGSSGGKKYNKLFDNFDPGDGIPGGGDPVAYNVSSTWDNTNDEILVGVDNSRGAFIRPISVGGDGVYGVNGASSFTVLPDDQWVQRADKVGFYGFLEEGRICIDSRAIVGLVV